MNRTREKNCRFTFTTTVQLPSSSFPPPFVCVFIHVSFMYFYLNINCKVISKERERGATGFMDSLPSVSPSIVTPIHHQWRRRRQITFSSTYIKPVNNLGVSSVSSSLYPRESFNRKQKVGVSCKLGEVNEREDENDKRDEELERALRMDGTIPGSSNEFVKQVSSRAYDMRRHLQQSFDSSSYDVLEANPWREKSKSVYVLTYRENQLCTMKTRRNRSEVETELGRLFSNGGKWRNQSKQSGVSCKFQMLVEDIQEGVLVFEDENEAARYCDLLRGGGQDCEGVVEIDASSVFDLCTKIRALAVLFRRGITPPRPESLKLNLWARKRSLEDQEDFI